MKILNICKKLTIAAAILSLVLFSAQSMAKSHVIDRIVIFGASLSDTGNAFIWLSEPANRHCGTSQNVPPFDALDESSVPDGPYAKGGHHFTNGATWVEGLAQSLSLAGNARPAFQNTGQEASNYAVGGARAVADFPCRFNFPAQVQTYLEDFPQQTSPDTLFAIEIGANDMRDALVAAMQFLLLNPNGDPAPIITPFIQDAIESISNAIYDPANINNLYNNGARKFLLMNVPDIGKTPAVIMLDGQLNQNGLIIGLAKQISQTFNAQLALLAESLSSSLGIDVKILDVNTTLDKVVTKPGDYGFIDTKDACVTPNQPPFICKKPDTYVFWDGIHPTKALHAIVAKQAIKIVSAP